MMASNKRNLLLLCLSCYYFFISPSFSDSDTLEQGQQLEDGAHLVSADETFKIGFFSPGTSKNRYLGIWYNIPDAENATFFDNRKVVWVANRNFPIFDESGVLVIDELGKLKISYNGGSSIGLSSVQSENNASAVILDSGNFVFMELNSNGSMKHILWQSFDYPTNTLLPGMKLGINMKTRHFSSLTSWISESIPAEGSFSLTIGVGINGSSQLIIWWKRSVYWTSGVWQNGHFELLPVLSDEGYQYHNFSYISNDEEKYFTYSINGNHTLARYMLDSKGAIAEATGLAPFGACSYKFDLGCVEQKLPQCRDKNDQFKPRKGFMSGPGVKFDGSYHLSLFDCEAMCLNNCSCRAYAFFTNDSLTGCETWSKGMRFTENNNEGREIYVLNHSKEAKWWIWIVIAVVGVAVLVFNFLLYFIRRRKLREEEFLRKDLENEQELLLYELEANTTYKQKRGKKNHELQVFSLESIASATNNFANTNKLGEGGFGPVYKGKLQDGQDIAVKRLARSSGQGLLEFKNELVLIAKLQHTNLVRLVGCCIQREEKMLIYEYMSNKSLDVFLFDSEKKKSLDWIKRLDIIEGIAQGLLYLHKYSRLRIIHRDLKASNILLDEDMKPKISDFGMARIFGKNESEANTNRIVGTYGYMSPEYALKGIVSMKVDVFSFGVLLLEIISGKKSNRLDNSGHPLNLIGYAWQLWNENRALELMEPELGESCYREDIKRCIHVSLLCVQEQAQDRPTMENVVLMLTKETMPLPPPQQPAFFIDQVVEEAGEPGNKSDNCSTNNVSISVIVAR